MYTALMLSNGQFALIDDDDFEWLAQYSWHQKRSGYVVGHVNRKKVYMHRLIMNAPSGTEVDHMNHNKLDNRRINLRIVSHAENCKNYRRR